MEIVQVSHFFPRFMDDNGNKRSMEAITDNHELRFSTSSKRIKSCDWMGGLFSSIFDDLNIWGVIC